MEAGAIKAGREDYHGGMTVHVLYTFIITACVALVFGYDIGISGGVTSMDSFLKQFFPSVYHQKNDDISTNLYCKYDCQFLTLYTSSLYIGGLFASVLASRIITKIGRKWCLFIGGITFLVGALVSGAALNVGMLFVGRIIMGIGVGFANHQSMHVYLCEISPHRHRDILLNCYQLMIVIGIFCANLINYSTSKIKDGWGWRVSLWLAAVPAIIITVGSLFLSDTPKSLIERGNMEQAKAILVKIRGTQDVHEEYEDLVAANVEFRAIKEPWTNIFQRKYRAQLTMAICIPIFQQLTGINVIIFYAPVLFKTIGFGDNTSLASAEITGGINILATIVSICIVRRVSRNALFLQGGIQMICCQVMVGSHIYMVYGTIGTGSITDLNVYSILIFVCYYVAGFAWTWGPLGWLVPSKLLPLEIRSAGQWINVWVHMIISFLIGQSLLSLLCHLKFGVFFFFAGWVMTITILIYFFLPETKYVPIEEMVFAWKQHWFWGKFMNDKDHGL